MAITTNRTYNDPALGAAFSNLAAAFMPPGGADMAGYASAAAKREEAKRLADLFAAAQSGGFDQTTFDRMGQATGQWTPSSGYYGVNVGAETDRRGQDVAAASAANVAGINNAGAMERDMAKPVILGEGQTAYVPGQTAAATGLPSTLSGMYNVAPGEKMVLPDGTVTEGAPKPLSEAEVKGAILQGLPPTDQRNSVIGDVPVETIMGANGPVVVARPDAIGQAPAPTGQVETQNYKTPDGRTGTAAFVNGSWRDSQSGAPIPEGSITFNSSLQGGKDETGLGLTTANQTDFNKQLAEADYALARIDTFEKHLQANPGSLGISGTIQGFVQDAQQGARDLVALYGDNGVVKSLDDLSAMVGEAAKAGGWNSAIYQSRLMALEMAYMEIKSQDPSGEVNVRELERVLPMFNGGIAGNQPVLDALQVTRQRWKDRQAAATGALGRVAPAPAAPTTAAPADGIPTVASPEEAMRLPKGTQFRDPEGNLRVVP